MNKLMYMYALAIPVFFAPAALWSQCGTGTTQAALNWDHIDFLPGNNNRYTDFYPSTSFPYTQNFSIGTRRVTFNMAPQGNITLNGENETNTAHANSPNVSAGADVQFTTTSASSTTIMMTFDAEVQNVRFSLFDLDNSQHANVTATNAASIAQNITMALANATNTTTITGTATSRTAVAVSGNFGNNDTRGAINITIPGPVLRIVITLSNAVGDIWLSDIDACVPGTFPIGYNAVSRPFTGQPQYVLTVVNNNIYYTNPTNGQSYFLFNEPAHNRLNSLAYDPYRRRVYYTFSLSPGNIPVTDKTVRVYDVDSKTISILIPNVNDFGIPTYETGVESGAASFYNGSLYLGIEGYTGESYAASRKSTVWRIDFDADGNPVAPASQVWGILADNGSDAQNIHDWSDFAVVDGKLIDFDGSGSGDYDYYHFDLMTGVQTEYTPVGQVPRQVSVGWDEKIYNVNTSISLYNGTTGQGTLFTIYAPLGPTIPTGNAASWGDAAGPYRPFLDFGDAPASYDPNPLSPACHDTLTPTVSGRRTRMRLGADEDVEWLKRGFTTVEDNFEDGLSFVPILSPVTGSYTARVDVFNNTGVNATVVAWLDYNGNGVFDAGEGTIPATVPSSNSNQTVDLVWSGIPPTLTSGSFTYLRIRITRQSYGMDQNDPTGYYSMGEVEDYRVVVENTVLPVHLISFDVKMQQDKSVLISWKAEEEINFPGYEIQKSMNGYDWQVLQFIPGSGQGGVREYREKDNQPYAGKTWYRLRIRQVGTSEKYSQVIWVHNSQHADMIRLWPNPVKQELKLEMVSEKSGLYAAMQIINLHGQVVKNYNHMLTVGNNQITVAGTSELPNGIYILSLRVGETIHSRRFVIQR